jgi:hypothetical protein
MYWNTYTYVAQDDLRVVGQLPWNIQGIPHVTQILMLKPKITAAGFGFSFCIAACHHGIPLHIFCCLSQIMNPCQNKKTWSTLTINFESFFKERWCSVFFPSTKDALPSLISHKLGHTTKLSCVGNIYMYDQSHHEKNSEMKPTNYYSYLLWCSTFFKWHLEPTANKFSWKQPTTVRISTQFTK